MSLVIRLVVAFGLVLLSASSWAQLNYYTLIDSDNNAATGCTVTLPTSGTVAGVERRLTATVSETATPQVTQLTLESCIGGSFAAPVPLPGAPYPVGSNNGVGGADAVEQAVETNAIAAPGASVRLYFAAQGPTSDDLLGSPNNPPILFNIQPSGGPADIPFLSGQGFLVLALLLLIAVIWQRSRLPAGMAGVLLVGALAGIAWAAGFRLDGQVNDWQGVPAIGSDAGGDSAPNTDIVTAFAAQEGGNLFFRSDIANAETSPSTNQPPSFTSTPIITASIASPYNYTITTRDPDGNALALTAPTLPAWLRFVPGANGAGTLSGTPGPADLGPHAVVLRVTDNGTPSLSADQAFTVTVGGAANPAPTLDLNGPAAGIDFAATFTEGGGAVAIVDPANLTVSDPDSPNLASATATLANLLDAGQETLAANAAAPITASFNATTGVLTLAGSAPLSQYQAALRTVTYSNAAAAPTTTPARVITFVISDGGNTSAPATATVTLASVNDAPSFTAANPPAVNEDSGPQTVNGWVTAFNPGPADEAAQTALAYTVSNASDVALFSTPPSVNAGGNLSYTPAPNAFGTSTFEVRVQDSGGTANGGQDTSAPQTFTVTVNGINDQPSFTASNPPAVNENAGPQTVPGWATFNPGNAQESAQTALAYTVSSVSNAALFSVQPSVAASGNLTYTPAVGANGASTFSVAVQDSGGTANGGVDTSVAQTFTITVNAVNDPPVANPDSATVPEGGTVTVLASTATSVLANDTDPDAADILSATTAPVSGPANGSLTLNANGTFSYTHNGGETTSDSFVYQTCDNGSPALCATATVSITITPVNDGPTANADSATVNEGGTVTALTTPASATSVRDNDTDPDNLLTALTVTTTPATPPANGSLTLNADGTFSYTHNGGETTTDSFVYEICDPQPLCSTATVSIIIAPVNDAPAIALPGPGAIYDTTGSPVILDATATASDVDSPNFDTGVLAANVTTNCDANDRLGVRNEGTGPNQIGVSGANITYNPGTGAITIGAIDTANTDFNCATPTVPTLRVALSASADLAATQALLRNLAFFSASTTPPTTQRTVEISLTDGDGGTSNTATKLVDLDAAPSVSAVAPANNATGVAIDADVVITFSEAVTVTGNWFQIACPTSGNRSALSGTAVTGGPTAFTINPSADFANGEACTVTVTATQITDQDATDPPDDMAADFNSTFTTVDIAPTVLGTSTPANGAVVPTNQTVVLNFSEAVDVVPANIGLVCGATVTFTTSGTSNVTSITLTPTSTLPEGASCTLTVPVTAATDTDAVDPPDQLDAPFNRSFTVDTAPTFTGSTPANSAIAVALNSDIQLTFSEAVNVTASSFGIDCGGGGLAYAIGGSGTASVTLNPTADLPGGASCTVTITGANVSDSDGADPPDVLATNPSFSFTTASVANDDSYNATPHLTLSSAAGATEVDVNDQLGSGTITGFGFGACTGTAPGAQLDAGVANGRLTLNADGSFSYEPPAVVANATRTFCYTVTGGDTANIVFNLQNTELVWFIDASAAGGGIGTQARPFQTLAAVAAVDTPADTLYIADGNYTCGITLANSENVLGDGSTQGLAVFTGITPVTGSAFPILSGTAPVLTATDADCLALDATAGNTHTLRGFTIGDTGAAGTDIAGTNFGTLTVNEVTLSGTGRALNLNNGTLTATFTGVSSSSGTNNVTLISVAGISNFGGGALSGASSHAFNMDQGAGSFTYAGTINNTAARSVSITNKTGGTVTFSGAVSGTAQGVVLTTNTGATINFSGGVTLNTGANAAFTATGGGTVNVTGTGNTLTSTTGTALNVANTTIGASGLTFRSISSNGGVNGIVLNNTGSSGGLTVTGTGANDSGGTILNKTGDAISLTQTGPVSLSWMRIEDNLGNGIFGTTVNGLSLTNVRVIDNADDDAIDEAGIRLLNLLGTSTWSSIEVADSLEDNAQVINNGTNNLTQLTISNSVFRDNSLVSPGNNGLIIQADGSANMTVDIVSSDFLRNRANGVQVVNNGTGTVDVEVGDAGSEFTDNNIGVSIAHNGPSPGRLLFDVTPGTFNSTLASPINLNLGGVSNAGSLMEGNAINNNIDNNDSLTGPGIRVTGNGGGTMTLLLQGNNIIEVANRGIEIIARDGSNTINPTLFGNDITLNSALAADAVHIASGAISTDTTSICADINGDNVGANRNFVFSNGGDGVEVRERFAGTSFTLEDYSGSPTDLTAVQNFLSARNDGGDTFAASGSDATITFGTTANCPSPTP